MYLFHIYRNLSDCVHPTYEVYSVTMKVSNTQLTHQDYGVVDYIRLRVMPVLGTSPSIFGQAMAAYVLCSLAGTDTKDSCNIISAIYCKCCHYYYCDQHDSCQQP